MSKLFFPKKIKFTESNFNNSQTEVSVSNLILIVGPNNSGKSTFLREFANHCNNNGSTIDPHNRIIIESLKFANQTISEQRFNKLINEMPDDYRDLRGDTVHLFNSYDNSFQEIPLYTIRTSGDIFNIWLRYNTLFLDYKTRIKLIEDQSFDNLHSPPSNILSHLFRKDELRKKIQNIIRKEFGLYLYVDITGNSRKLVLKKVPISDEKNLNKENVRLFKETILLSSSGSGIQSFTSILLSLFTYKKIIFIDEPELSLHQPTAYNLGRIISNIGRINDISFVIATHSPEFVLGILENELSTTIIRLTYNNDIGSFKTINPATVRQFFEDPFLRSVGTISALFYKGIIIVEGQEDRVFFSEINRKLLYSNFGNHEILYLNGIGKASLSKISLPLDKIDVPVVRIYDLDVLNLFHKDKGKRPLIYIIVDELALPCEESSIIKQKIELLSSILMQVNSNEKDNEPNIFKNFYFYANRVEFKDLAMLLYDIYETLRESGVFITPGGELESWLPEFGIPRTFKKNWLLQMIYKIGSEDKQTLISNDIGYFVRDIFDYLNREIANSEE